MSENTKIQWADHTFNPWEGCTKVSPGCLNCYADTRAQRFGQVKWGKGQPRRRTSAANWKLPVKWNRTEELVQVSHAGFVENTRPRVFCASLADWLDEEVPIEWLADLLKLIHDTPNLDWLLLTKRPENWKNRLAEVLADKLAGPQWPAWNFTDGWLTGDSIPPNVWLGVSVEDQTRADERIPKLLSIPAKVRFLSCELLLGPVDLKDWGDGCSVVDPFEPGINWCIIGGESGPNARPCNVEWIRSLLEQCRAAGVAPFVKQLGSNSKAIGYDNHHEDKKGGDPAEWHPDLQVREFPT